MRPIDADELSDRMCREAVDTREKIAHIIDTAPTVDTIPVEWVKDYIFRAARQDVNISAPVLLMLHAWFMENGIDAVKLFERKERDAKSNQC